MTIKLLVLAGIVFAIGASPVAAQTQKTPATDTKTSTIRGRITAADTGRPLRRARVTIRSASETGGIPAISANTNSLGQFEAKDVPRGSYYVVAARAGYLNVQYGQRRAGETGLTVDVRGGEVVERIDLSLPRGGVLTGRITDELGEPYPGVRVDALSLRYERGQRVPSPTAGATTDDLGQFRISGLQPGSYYLLAMSSETWLTEKKETFGYASTYFPAGPRETAHVITVGPSEQRGDLNFSLLSSRAVRITGRLQRETGEPVAGGQLSLAYSYAGSIITTAGGRLVRTDPDGSFEFKNVADRNLRARA